MVSIYSLNVYVELFCLTGTNCTSMQIHNGWFDNSNCTIEQVVNGTICNLSCFEGYQVVGYSQLECNGSGLWHPASLPYCQGKYQSDQLQRAFESSKVSKQKIIYAQICECRTTEGVTQIHVYLFLI